MSGLATPEQSLQAVRTIQAFINSHEAVPFTGTDYEFLIYMATLKQPRTIGERIANYLQLAKGVTGSLAVVAYYQTTNSLLDPKIKRRLEAPIRDIHISGDAPPTYTYDGIDIIDAQPYPLPAIMLDELVGDVATAS